MPGRSVLKPTDGAPDAPQPADLGVHEAAPAPGNGVLEGEVTQPGEQHQPPPAADEPRETVLDRLENLEQREENRERALRLVLDELKRLQDRIRELESELGTVKPVPVAQLPQADDEVAKAQAILDREQDARVGAASEEGS